MNGLKLLAERIGSSGEVGLNIDVVNGSDCGARVE
jgi:hypothetical protein